jgi:hypothetical protein
VGPHLSAQEHLLRAGARRESRPVEGARLPGQRHAERQRADPVDRGRVRAPARAGHALVPEGGTMADVRKDYDAIMAWFDRR